MRRSKPTLLSERWRENSAVMEASDPLVVGVRKSFHLFR